MADILKSFVRVAPVATLAALARAASHGRRLDPSAQRRVDPQRTPLNVAFSSYRPEDPLDLVGAWRAAVSQQGASPYGRAPVAAHLLIGVSPQVIDEAGCRHDSENPANVSLVREAVAWAESEFGPGSVIAGRLDVDEHGAGVVDIIVVPVRVTRMNRYATKPIISISQALTEIHRAHGAPTSYGALQTSWAAWAARRIDPRIRRGTPKAETHREHVHADVYRYVAAACEASLRTKYNDDLAVALNAVASERAALEATREVLAEKERALDTYARDLERWRGDLESYAATEKAAAEAAAGRAVDGVARGLRAYRTGRMTPDRRDGRAVVKFAGLTPAEVDELKSALAPAWPIGLMDLLIDLHEVERREHGLAL